MTVGNDRLWSEVSYLAFWFHWPLDDILDLEHAVRSRFVGEINAMRSAAGR